MSTEAKKQFTLYTAQTPNGVKISIALEELNLPYDFKTLTFSKNEQKEPWFLAINPNGRIPALTDHSPPFGGGDYHVFESGAILQYLADNYDPDHRLSFPRGTREYYDTACWLFFQNAGVGPMQGQANHFVRYAPEKIEYGMTRYVNETRRLYSVLEERLKANKTGFLVGDHISIADISHYGWVASAGWAGVDIEEFPTLKEWEERLAAREGVHRGHNVPSKFRTKELVKDREAAEKSAKQASSWVMAGQHK